MKKRKILSLILALSLVSFSAKAEKKLLSWWNETFLAAEVHPGLVHAYEPLELQKIKKYVVLLQDGIPAERAPYFITWQDYDYRAAIIKGQKIKTHRGAPYTKLRKGDVLAVVSPDHFSNKLYVNLITPEIYQPEHSKDKNFSRVTVMLGFQFPRSVFKQEQVTEVETKIGEWLKTFSSYEEAKQFAASIKTGA